MSDRSLFMAALLLAFAATVPTWALAKLQWCDDNDVRNQAELTIKSITVDGESMDPPTDLSFDLTTSPGGWIDANLWCYQCDAHVVRWMLLERQP